MNATMVRVVARSSGRLSLGFSLGFVLILLLICFLSWLQSDSQVGWWALPVFIAYSALSALLWILGTSSCIIYMLIERRISRSAVSYLMLNQSPLVLISIILFISEISG